MKKIFRTILKIIGYIIALVGTVGLREGSWLGVAMILIGVILIFNDKIFRKSENK